MAIYLWIKQDFLVDNTESFLFYDIIFLIKGEMLMDKVKEIWDKLISIELNCPYCGKSFQFKATEWNTKRKCPQCKKGFKVQLSLPAMGLLFFVGLMICISFYQFMLTFKLDFFIELILILLFVNLYSITMYRLMAKIFKKEQVFRITMLKDKTK